MPDRFQIVAMPSAVAELRQLRAFDRKRIETNIDNQLQFEPVKPSRHRKLLFDPQAPFPFEPPLWELRVGDYRVFYDVDIVAQVVYIRAIREKRPHATTDQIL